MFQTRQCLHVEGNNGACGHCSGHRLVPSLRLHNNIARVVVFWPVRSAIEGEGRENRDGTEDRNITKTLVVYSRRSNARSNAHNVYVQNWHN
jgi:hypothetical protein